MKKTVRIILEIIAAICAGLLGGAGAQALMKEVKGRVKGLDDADRAEEMRQNAHERSMDRARINAVRDIAVAYAKSRPRVIYNTRIIRTWW